MKGFQEYLGGALQDLVQSVENLELVVLGGSALVSPLVSAGGCSGSGAWGVRSVSSGIASAAVLSIPPFQPTRPQKNR